MYDSEEEHPSYGMIGACRTQGGNFHLFGSRLKHNSTVEITLRAGKVGRMLSRDWYSGHEEIVSVRLTETQWASFVAAMNVGRGVPCTIEHVKGERMPPCPAPPDSISQHGEEHARRVQKALQSMTACTRKLSEMVDGKVSVKTLREIVREFQIILGNLPSNLRFSEEQFTEHVESVVAEAKADIEAHMLNLTVAAGKQALVDASEALQLPPTSREEPE